MRTRILLPETDAQTEPFVGMGVTGTIGSDSYPYTIIGIVNSNTIVIQSDDDEIDKEKSDPSYGGNKVYNIYRDPLGDVLTITKRKDGSWRHIGASTKTGSRFTLGMRRRYNDPHF